MRELASPWCLPMVATHVGEAFPCTCCEGVSG